MKRSRMIAKKALKILRGIGDEGTRRLQVSGLSEEDKRKPDKLWEFFESQLKPKINFRVHRLHLMECWQREDETLDDFILRVRTLAMKCEFDQTEMEERLIELIIASTPLEDFQRDLLGKAKGYKLADALAEGRRYQAIVAGRSKLQQLNPSTGEHKLDLLSNKQAQKSRSCGNCNTSHEPRKCPAFDSTCHHCGKKGHWRRACRQRKREDLARAPSSDSKRKIKERKKIHDMASESEDTSDDDDIKHDTINIFSIRNEVFATVDVVAPGKTGKTPIKLKIDTGASGNTLTLQTFRNLYGKRDPSKVITPVKNTKLTAYNGQKIPCYGSLDLELSHKGKLTKAKFYVVDVEGPCIIGLPTCEKLKLVTINCNEINTTDVSSVESLKQAYPGQVDTLGDFQGPAQLHTKLGAEPSIDPPRKCSVHLEEQLKAELEKMVKQGVIRKVKEHTDWCSSLAYSVKKDGSLRICIDPQKLNAALKRCPQVHWIVSIQQDGCQGRILVSPPRWAQPTADHVPNALRPLLLETTPLWTACITRHLSGTNGWNTRRSPRRGRHYRRCVRTWQGYAGAWRQPQAPDGKSQAVWTCLQLRKVRHTQKRNLLLWEYILHGRDSPWSSQNSRHPEYASPWEQRRPAEIPWHDDVSVDVYPKFQQRITTAEGAVENRRSICHVRRPHPLLQQPQKAGVINHIPQVLWPEETNCAGGWQFHERLGSSHHSGWIPSRLRIQVTWLHPKQLPKHWPWDARGGL